MSTKRHIDGSPVMAHRAEGSREEEAAALDAPTADVAASPHLRKLQIAPAPAADAASCLRSLARRPDGVELLETPMYEVHCGKRVWMIVFNGAFGEPGFLPSLRERSRLVAVIALRDAFGSYVRAHVVVARPGTDGDVRLAMTRSTGGVVCVGRLAPRADHATFNLQSVEGPRPFTLRMEGRLRTGRLEIDVAETAMGVKRQPHRERWDERPRPSTLS